MLNTYGISDEDQKALLKQGIYPTDPIPFSKIQNAIGVFVETALPDDADIKPLQWTVNLKSSRGTVISCSDWNVDKNESGQKILSFIASMVIPECIFERTFTASSVSCSFTDLCWYQGSEEIAESHRPETLTKLADGFGYGDLGWALPSRFTDRLIDALGKLNDCVVSGILEDAILTGPLFSEDT